MGCVSTRPEVEDNPRIFRVINVDTSGRHLRRGRLEVTDTQLVFYQRGGGVVIRWPLTCLRRYGFDSEIFSFECGRRCATGSGVYGFKCRRAEALFTMLQESINHPPPPAANSEDNRPPPPPPVFPTPPVPNGTVPTVSSPTVDESGYLEPITVNPRLQYQPTTSSNGTMSPGGYVCIHESSQSGEWPSNLPRCCSLGGCSRISTPPSSTHHYINNSVIDKDIVLNRYVNQSVILAEEQLMNHCCSPTRTCSEENAYVNSSVISPSHLARCCSCPNGSTVDFNTNYAKLNDLMKQEQSSKMQHFYVNIKSDPAAQRNALSGSSSSTDLVLHKGGVVSLVSPSKVIMSSQCLGESSLLPEPIKEQQDEVNYAELDLDATESGPSGEVPVSVSTPNSLHSLTNSPAKASLGYAQIDFDKTVALSISANPHPLFDDDSMRKTRHNAVIPYTNMSQ